jgi:putative N6-adenine-specific DNA methylase
MVATTFFGLEQVLAQELTLLGAVDVRPTRFAVHFRGDTELLYRANLWLRTAIRVLVPLERFEIRSADDLYRRVVGIDWSRYMSVDGTGFGCLLSDISSYRISGVEGEGWGGG